jgi:tetratricopeptide (TPR) repeat protein
MSTTGDGPADGGTPHGAGGGDTPAAPAAPGERRREAEIITFYSFKGGAGRTMALANTAWVMASAGHSVLVVDWDLEAPGLHRYYRQFLPDPDLRHSAGLLDIFHGFQAAATGDGTGEFPADLTRLHEEHTAVQNYTVAVGGEFRTGGRLDYLGPGRMDEGYADRLGTFNWAAFHASEEGHGFLEALRRRLKAAPYDYVLIDSRTGFSDGAGICTLALPDTVVIGLVMNSQAIEGAKAVARRIRRAPRPIRLHVLPMHIDLSEKTRLDQRLGEARHALDRFLDIGGEEALRTYWGEVQVPYQPYYAYGEELAVFVDNPNQRIGILAQYVAAARRISDGAVAGFEPVTSDQRRWYDHTYVAVRPARPQSATLLHAPDDELWAEWIGEQLRMAGIRVETHPAGPDGAGPAAPDDGWDGPDDGEAGQELPETDYVLVLLSGNLTGSAAGRTAERLSAGAPVGGPEGRQVVGVRIDGGRLATWFDWLDAVNLVGLSREPARRALLARFGVRVTDDHGGSPAGPRFPGNRPDVWRVALRVPDFTGRADTLEWLREHFGARADAAGGPAVLCGMPGVGKSGIALEYAHRFASQYDLVWWVPAGSPETVRASLTELARALNERAGGRRTGEGWAELLDDLRRGVPHPRWLLVLDDAESPEAVMPFIPTGGAGHVLITSRSPGWSGFATRPVDALRPEESAALLHARLPAYQDTGGKDLERLAGRLGHLPIALDSAIRSLDDGTQTVDAYIARLDESGPLLGAGEDTGSLTALATDDPANAGLRNFGATCVVALRGLAGHPAAERLLQYCAFLSPDGVALSVVQSPAMLDRLAALDPALRDTIRVPGLINRITRPGLAVLDPATRVLKVHRLVQDLLRERMTPRERSAARAEVLGVLAAMSPGTAERDEPARRPAFQELDKHLAPSGALDSDDPAVRDWVINQVRHRWFTGDWAGGADLGQRALDAWLTRHPAEDPHTLRLETQLAAALRQLGRYPEALEHSAHAATALAALDRADPHTLLARRGHAFDLLNAGHLAEALRENRTVYSGLEALFGHDHPETLNSSNNLAWAWFYTGSLNDAIRQAQATYDARLRVLGPHNPLTWSSCATLGGFQCEAGRLAPAAELLTEARDRLVRLEGENGFHTLTTVVTLAETDLRGGRVREALQLLQSAHAPLRDQCGAGHASTLTCVLALAAGLHASGRSGEAADYAADALEHYRRGYQDHHPFTARCRANLALYLLDSGRAHEARREAGRAVNDLTYGLGRDHRFTLAARITLANARLALGEAAPAEIAAEDEEIYTACVDPDHGWGPGHRVTLVAAANFAGSGPPADTAEARRALERALRDHDPAQPLTATLAELSALPHRRTGADI